jgi:hypothetical protein
MTETYTSGPTRLVRPRNTPAMQRRRFDPSRSWIRSAEYQAPSGRWLRPGVEFSIHGERGRFRFLEHVVNGDVEWIGAIGGTKGVRMHRSFRVDAVKRVFVKRQILTTEEARQLVNEKNREKRSVA